MSRLARLSALRVPRETPADAAEYERVRAGVSAVLTAARVLRDADSSASTSGTPLDRAFAALSEADADAVAEARWASLRRDDVTEGAADVARFAALRDGPFFVAPVGSRDGGGAT